MKYVNSTFERDRKVVETVIRRYGPVSQVNINQLTDIRPTTVSQLVRDLLDEGRVLEVGRSNNPIGRKQVLLLPNNGFRFVAAVAFDEEVICAGVMDLEPRIRHTVNERIRPGASRDDLVGQLLSCVRRAVSEAGLTFDSVIGVGISDPGLVDTNSGVTVMSSTIPYWKDIPLKAIFEEEFSVPVSLQTSTRAKTLAEQTLGAAKTCDNAAYIDYGTGIGSGIVVDGKLLHGARGAAGEFGHTHVIEGGPVCSCGSYGCLEAIAGTRALEARLRKAIADGGTTRALDLVGGDMTKLSGWTVLDGAARGDKLCGHIVAELANYLGVALANLVNLFNPSMVVLDQRLKPGGPELLNAVIQTMRRYSLAYSTENLEVRYAEFGDEAGLLGAALVVVQAYFEIPALKPPRFLKEAHVGLG